MLNLEALLNLEQTQTYENLIITKQNTCSTHVGTESQDLSAGIHFQLPVGSVQQLTEAAFSYFSVTKS